MKKNRARSSMRFVSAAYVPRQGMLEVVFENGDRFLIATESVAPAADGVQVRKDSSRGANRAGVEANPNWRQVRIGPTGDVLEVPTRESVLEIPWDRIRSIVDPAFRAHLIHRATERARRIGTRIRGLRLESGVTRAVLAKRIGIGREVIVQWEAGKLVPPIGWMEKIARALGRRLSDFAEIRTKMRA